jgi:hypothetical protein
MKLPKDKVRLKKEAQDFGHISYVLTVSPDIYQKVVLELVHSHATLLSGYFESEDKLSIQVAIGLLSVILILIFINVIDKINRKHSCFLQNGIVSVASTSLLSSPSRML